MTQRKAGAAVHYQDPAFGFSLTAPAGWMFYRSDVKDGKDASRVVVVDPEVAATTVVNVGNRNILTPDEQKSLRAWAEKEVIEGEAVKVLKALTIRPDSWKDRTVAGKPGLSVMGDFEDGKDKKVGYGVFSMGISNAVVFTLITAAKDFEAFQPKFEALVDSYKEE